MHRFMAWDVALFHWINRDLASPWLDGVMRFLSYNRLFEPVLVGLALLMTWRGGRRGRVFLVVVAAGAALANGLVVDPLKGGVGRARPWVDVPETILRVGHGHSHESLPSGHALLTTTATVIAGWYYPRVLWGLVPLVLGIGYSRVYNGAHYPSDVLAGFALGTAFAGAYLWGVERVWRTLAPRWCRRCAERSPSLLRPERGAEDYDAGSAPMARA